jgi:hypothetical protein
MRKMKVGDLVRCYHKVSLHAKKTGICVGLIIDKRKDGDWRWPMYLIEWSRWPGEPEWFYPHLLTNISEVKDTNETHA